MTVGQMTNTHRLSDKIQVKELECTELNTICEGMMGEQWRKARPQRRWSDDIKEWTNLECEEQNMKVKDQTERKLMCDGIPSKYVAVESMIRKKFPVISGRSLILSRNWRQFILATPMHIRWHVTYTSSYLENKCPKDML